MALIPRSQGREVSRPTLQQHTPMTGLANIGQSIGNALEARDQKQQEAEVSAKRAELYHNDLGKQEAKIKLDDVMTREMSEQVTLLKNDVSNGAMTADVANKNLQLWSENRYKQMEGEMPEHARTEMKSYWSDNTNRNASGFLPLQLRADAQKDAVLADRVAEIATRYDRKQGREYLESSLASLNRPESDKQERLYKYESTRDLLDIDDRINTAVQNRDPEALSGLINEMKSGGFGYTDAKTLQQKEMQAVSRIDAINKQVEVEENKRVQMAGKVLNDFKTQVLTGRALDDDYLASVGAAVVGTEYEAEYNFYKSQSNNFQSFSKLSTPEQLKRINDRKAAMANSKSADPQTEEKILGVYQSIYEKKIETLKNNPNQAVREAGLETNSLSAGELKANPKSFAAKAIDNGVSQLALKDPNIVVKPISTEDLPEAKQTFEAKSVNGKLDFIGELINQSKGVPNGSKIWSATIGQLGGGDLSYLMAGVARANNYRSKDGEDVAAAIISGTQSLKNKALVMPKDDLLKTKFNEYVGNSASGETANMSFSAFKSIYAHLMERNSAQGGTSETIETSIANAALSLATGGVYEQGLKYGTGNKKWKVSKPYGMDDDRFEDGVNKGYAAISQATGISTAELEGFRLRRSDKRSKKGEIQYDLIDERGTPLQVGGVMWRINMQGATK